MQLGPGVRPSFMYPGEHNKMIYEHSWKVVALVSNIQRGTLKILESDFTSDKYSLVVYRLAVKNLVGLIIFNGATHVCLFY